MADWVAPAPLPAGPTNRNLHGGPTAAYEPAGSGHLDGLSIRILTPEWPAAIVPGGPPSCNPGDRSLMCDRMRSKQMIRRIGRMFGWLALALLFLTILTGYGITDFRLVEHLTAGLLGKAVSQRWHEYVGLSVLVALTFHVGIALWWRRKGAQD